MQALILQLRRGRWEFANKRDDRGRLTHLFLFRKSAQKILQESHEALVMDCIYKTNRYAMPLFVITINITFYVAFVFIAHEYTGDYQWVLQRLKLLYQKLSLPALTVIATDCERALANAL